MWEDDGGFISFEEGDGKFCDVTECSALREALWVRISGVIDVGC